MYFATASARDARDAVALTMAEFSDTVRPGVERLSSLGHPDVRLHLPKHHAIASWVTPEGRQSPFVAETIPLTIDRQRLALHAARQRERGAHAISAICASRTGIAPSVTPGHLALTILAMVGQSQRPAAADRGASTGASTATVTSLAQTPAESYRELVELDGAHSVRRAKPIASPRALEPDRIDVEMLAVIVTMRHVLTSQLHRRFNSGRSVTTTQRRLKRLSDAGLVDRFQFHRRDGGGIPMCYAVTAAGVGMLESHGYSAAAFGDGTSSVVASGAGIAGTGENALRQACHDVHVAGWVLALTPLLNGSCVGMRGPAASVLSPPTRRGGEGQVGLAPGDLQLPGGRTPHDFLRFDAAGRPVAAERFETLRPDAIVEIASAGQQRPAIDLIVELDDRPAAGAGARKLQRYDHFLSGWSVHVRRYGRRAEAVPMVVFVCRDRGRARECAAGADGVLCACRAYAGEYPLDWEYTGRERIVFVAERDVHEGLLRGYGVPRLPPEVRVSAAQGDPRAREATVEPRDVLAADVSA